MKKLALIIYSVFCFSVLPAQKYFDSTAYNQYYQNRWEKIHFDTSSNSLEKVLTAEEKIAGLSKAWAEAKYNFANFDLIPNVAWDSLYQAYIPKAVAAKSLEDYYGVLQNFYQHLRDGHTRISMPYAYYKNRDGLLPIEVRWIENKVIVTKNTSALKEDKRVKPGLEIVNFDHMPVAQYIQQNISPYLNFSTPQDSTERIYRYYLTPGKAGSEVAITFKDEKGKTFDHLLKRVAVERYWEPYPLVDFKVLPGNMGYLQVNSFNDSKVVAIFDSLFLAIAKTDALIIDIRNNGGGNGNNGFEILGCLTSQPFYTGKTVLRQYHPTGRAWGNVEGTEILGEDWKPYKHRLYTKPVVVLTSGATYSAAEDFTATFKGMGRGKVFGQPTGGSTGQPMSFNLPGGGIGNVCSKRDYFTNGLEFIGIGIQPDMAVQPTIKGIAQGKDEVLEAAVQYLKNGK